MVIFHSYVSLPEGKSHGKSHFSQVIYHDLSLVLGMGAQPKMTRIGIEPRVNAKKQVCQPTSTVESSGFHQCGSNSSGVLIKNQWGIWLVVSNTAGFFSIIYGYV